jgi:hypothetical protein
MLRWLERVNFSRIVVVLAITFGIALGLCGLNFLAVSRLSGRGGAGSLLMTTAWFELAAMILSAVGLVLCLVGWGVRSIIGTMRHGRSTPQRLFDDDNSDDETRR